MAFHWRHLSRPRAAWKKYDHYRRLEEHGEPLPWHGRKAWRRVALTALVLVVIAGAGLYHRWEESLQPDPPQIIRPLSP